MSEDKYGDTRLQVITDIDDTVKSSGGLRLLGKLGVNIGPALGGLDTQVSVLKRPRLCMCARQHARVHSCM